MANYKASLVDGQPVVLPVDDSEWTSYPGSISGSGSKVFTTIFTKYRQVRNGYEIAFAVSGNNVASGGAATALTLSLPSGALIDSNYLPNPSSVTDSTNDLLVDGYEFSITALAVFTTLAGLFPASTSSVQFLRSGGGVITAAAVNNTNTPQIVGKFWVPIQGLSAYRAYGAGRANSNRDGLIAPRGDWVDLTVTGTSWTTQRAKGSYYQEQNGTHKLKFNIYGLFPNAARASSTISVTGVVFGPNYQGVTSYVEDSAGSFVPSGAYAGNGNNNIAIKQSNIAGNLYMISGDVELSSKPSWA